MATIYFHIGAPKTATSSLQAVLARDDASLLTSGVLYPRSCRHANAHHPLICDLMSQHGGPTMPGLWYGDVTPGAAWDLLVDELEQQRERAGKVIISSELFFGQAQRLESILGDLVSRLPGHELYAVVYLRRQDQMYASFYNQDVKGTRQWGDDAYQFYQTHRLFERDYHSVCSAWGEAFGAGRVLIRPYDREAWVQGDIVSDFCEVAGLPLLRSEGLESNESLGPTALYVKRCLNRTGYDKALNDAVLLQLSGLLPEERSGECRYVNRRQYRHFREQWLSTNRRLAAEFLDGQALFSSEPPTAAELPEYVVDRAVLVDFARRVSLQLRRGSDRAMRTLFARATWLAIAEQSLWEELDGEVLARLGEWL